MPPWVAQGSTQHEITNKFAVPLILRFTQMATWPGNVFAPRTAVGLRFVSEDFPSCFSVRRYAARGAFNAQYP
jgi:hypothetical protein